MELLVDQTNKLPPSSSSSSPAWIPIDDSRGIWSEFRQGSVQQQQQQQQQREEPSPIEKHKPELRIGIHRGGDEVEAVIAMEDDYEDDEDFQSCYEELPKSMGPAHEQHRKMNPNNDTSAGPSPLQALKNILSLDFLFGCMASKQEVPEQQESIGLRNNVNAEIAWGLIQDQEGDCLIAAGEDPEGYYARRGYSPGMKITEINGDPCPGSLETVYDKLELTLEAMDDNTKTTQTAVISVHDPKLDLYVRKNHLHQMYLAKVEAHSTLARAGFRPGMRLTRVNGRKCPPSFRELSDLLCADVQAIPKELIVHNSNNLQRTISNLSLPYNNNSIMEEPKRVVEESNNNNGISNSTIMLDLPKPFWLNGGGAGGGGLMMIAAH